MTVTIYVGSIYSPKVRALMVLVAGLAGGSGCRTATDERSAPPAETSTRAAPLIFERWQHALAAHRFAETAITPYDATGTFGRLWQAAEPLEPEFAKALAQASATSLIPPELGDGELNFPSFTNPTGYRWLGSSPFLPDDAGIVLYEEPLYLYAVVVRFDQEGELVTFLPVAGMESASQVHTGLRATFSDNAVAVTTIVESMGTRRERSRAVALRIDGATLGAPTPWLDVLK